MKITIYLLTVKISGKYQMNQLIEFLD